MMRALKRNGPTFDIRRERQIRYVLASTGGGLLRNTERERAKVVLHKFLAESFDTGAFFLFLEAAATENKMVLCLYIARNYQLCTLFCIWKYIFYR